MAKIITIANQKGGVAKTTTVRHLADCLALHGRVLVIDNDHQANLTQYFGLDPVKLQETTGTLYHVVEGERSVKDVRIEIKDQLHVVPSSLALAEAAARLVHKELVNEILKMALQEAKDDYDFVLIDCGPNLERLLINALYASDQVLIPTKTDSMSISGIPALVQTIMRVRRANPNLTILGILPTIYHKDRIADEKALTKLREEGEKAGVPVFPPIPAATAYDRAAGEQRSVFEAYPLTRGQIEYQQLAKIIISS